MTLSQPLQLDREQQHALATALSNNLAIISGGPGTGKTSIVLTLLRCLIRGGFAPERIALAAPTGRAAQRLTDALRAGRDKLPSANDAASPDSGLRELAATTLHQLLGYRPTRNVFARHAENPIPADVVIVDEVSMVGLVLMSQLLASSSVPGPNSSCSAIRINYHPWTPGRGAGESQFRRAVGLTCTRCKIGRSSSCRRIIARSSKSGEAAQAINAQDGGIVDRLPAVAALAQAMPHGGGQPRMPHAAAAGYWSKWSARRMSCEGFLQHWAELAYFRSRAGRGHAGGNDHAAIEVGDFVQDDVRATQARFKQLFTLLDRFRLADAGARWCRLGLR